MQEELQRLIYKKLGYIPTDVQEQIIAGVPRVHAVRQVGATDGIIIKALSGAMLGKRVHLTACTEKRKYVLTRRTRELAQLLDIHINTYNNIVYSATGYEGIDMEQSTVIIPSDKWYYDNGKYTEIKR